MKKNLFPLFVILVAACATTLPPSPTSTSLPHLTPDLINSTPIIVSPTKQIFTPEILPTQTPTIVSSPFPTLPIIKAQEKVNELLRTNLDCSLPCWWGMVPGETLWQPAKTFLDEFTTYDGELRISSELTLRAFDFPIEGYAGRLNLYTSNSGIISSLTVQSTYKQLPNYSPRDIFISYGEPKNTFIFTYSESYGDGVLPFLLALDYSDRGFVVIFDVNAEMSSTNIKGCLTNLFSHEIYLFSPTTFEFFIESEPRLRIWPQMKSIEEATSINAGDFYSLILQKDSQACIQTSSSLWKPTLKQ